jgi:hypothetical protein
MKYLCLVYLERSKWNAIADRECANCGDSLHESGKLLAAEPLFPVETATTVRVRHGRTVVTDGPFAETKEQLLGFYIVDVADLDDALGVARELAAANPGGGAYEVRPVRELDTSEKVPA